MYDIEKEFNLARKEILESVKAEMLGPGSEDIGPDIEKEVITDSPLKRYSIGILYPQENIMMDEHSELEKVESDNEREEESEEETNEVEELRTNKNIIKNGDFDIENELDEEINLANQYLPSAMGMTFFIKNDIEKLKIRLSCARYRLSSFEDCCVRYDGKIDYENNEVFNEFISFSEGMLKLKKPMNYQDINILKGTGIFDNHLGLIECVYKLCNQCTDFKYKKCGYVREKLDLDNPIQIKIAKNFERVGIGENNELEIVIVKRLYNDICSITIMLVNKLEGKPKVSNTFFQPQIEVNSEDNKVLEFVEYLSNPHTNKDQDAKSLELIYRNKKIYATGHGGSAVYKVNGSGKGVIKTDYMPIYEVPNIDFKVDEIGELSNFILPMKNLSDISEYSKDKIINNLKKFSETYREWIKNLEQSVANESKYFEIGKSHLQDCNLAYSRIQYGIELLEKNQEIYDAFCLANRAMLMQRKHSQCKERYPNEGVLSSFSYSDVKDSEASWRPFQLAFILMLLKSISEDTSDDRELVDLIWVPTGGGKTEAYLGLTAFTIFLRRMREPIHGAGTAIIMRYTLRLLAAQQFIRASILICACEKIRREGKVNLGKVPITIGLWLGGSSTPNTNKEAKECVDELHKAEKNELESSKGKYNKFQLLKCPWCGTKMVKEVVDRKTKGMWGYGSKSRTLFCPEENCEFEEKLPIEVIDEEIYQNPPTLLFGTVDKFAMMTWKSEVSSLFALNDGNKNKSPELIIQDELHLISGPLGTVVGLYEVALDAMCSAKGVKPKIIASTATIRRAKEQCKNLFNREVKQFPPPGLLAEDSFFVREISIDKKPGRMYCGIMSSGKTQTTVEIRLMAAILQKVHMIDLKEEIKDKYWSLVTYFNSIRELGKCSTLVADDIKDAMRRLARRIESSNKTRLIFDTDELTGRVSANQIIKTLERLEIEYTEENMKNKKYPVNVLLASNMISVGVDVSRLSLMLVVGQPKLTAEYIQASSRVGRRYPGLVFTLYDGARSRDRSHFEKFYSYHQSFYRFVEPTSVTPFSEPVRDRALHAVLISMMRHIYGLNDETMASAFKFEDKEIREKVSNIEKYVVDRIRCIDESLVDETVKDMKQFWEKWNYRIENLVKDELLTYSDCKKGGKQLIKSYSDNDDCLAIETLNSMRNVDIQSAVNIIEFGDETNEEN